MVVWPHGVVSLMWRGVCVRLWECDVSMGVVPLINNLQLHCMERVCPCDETVSRGVVVFLCRCVPVPL